jgi:hypothetical protein
VPAIESATPRGPTWLVGPRGSSSGGGGATGQAALARRDRHPNGAERPAIRAPRSASRRALRRAALARPGRRDVWCLGLVLRWVPEPPGCGVRAVQATRTADNEGERHRGNEPESDHVQHHTHSSPLESRHHHRGASRHPNSTFRTITPEAGVKPMSSRFKHLCARLTRPRQRVQSACIPGATNKSHPGGTCRVPAPPAGHQRWVRGRFQTSATAGRQTCAVRNAGRCSVRRSHGHVREPGKPRSDA